MITLLRFCLSTVLLVFSILRVVVICPVAVEFSAVVGNNNVHRIVTSLSAFVHKVACEEKQRL